MRLTDKLKNNRGYTLFEKILLISAASVLGGMIAGALLYGRHQTRNLEENAISVGGIFSRNGARYEDLDKNGKFETILNYKTREGKDASVLIQYNDKGYPTTKPYKIETQYDSLKNKESKTIKIVE